MSFEANEDWGDGEPTQNPSSQPEAEEEQPAAPEEAEEESQPPAEENEAAAEEEEQQEEAAEDEEVPADEEAADADGEEADEAAVEEEAAAEGDEEAVEEQQEGETAADEEDSQKKRGREDDEEPADDAEEGDDGPEAPAHPDQSATAGDAEGEAGDEDQAEEEAEEAAEEAQEEQQEEEAAAGEEEEHVDEKFNEFTRNQLVEEVAALRQERATLKASLLDVNSATEARMNRLEDRFNAKVAEAAELKTLLKVSHDQIASIESEKRKAVAAQEASKDPAAAATSSQAAAGDTSTNERDAKALRDALVTVEARSRALQVAQADVSRLTANNAKLEQQMGAWKSIAEDAQRQSSSSKAAPNPKAVEESVSKSTQALLDSIAEAGKAFAASDAAGSSADFAAFVEKTVGCVQTVAENAAALAARNVELEAEMQPTRDELECIKAETKIPLMIRTALDTGNDAPIPAAKLSEVTNETVAEACLAAMLQGHKDAPSAEAVAPFVAKEALERSERLETKVKGLQQLVRDLQVAIAADPAMRTPASMQGSSFDALMSNNTSAFAAGGAAGGSSAEAEAQLAFAREDAARWREQAQQARQAAVEAAASNTLADAPASSVLESQLLLAQHQLQLTSSLVAGLVRSNEALRAMVKDSSRFGGMIVNGVHSSDVSAAVEEFTGKWESTAASLVDSVGPASRLEEFNGAINSLESAFAQQVDKLNAWFATKEKGALNNMRTLATALLAADCALSEQIGAQQSESDASLAAAGLADVGELIANLSLPLPEEESRTVKLSAAIPAELLQDAQGKAAQELARYNTELAELKTTCEQRVNELQAQLNYFLEAPAGEGSGGSNPALQAALVEVRKAKEDAQQSRNLERSASQRQQLALVKIQKLEQQVKAQQQSSEAVQQLNGEVKELKQKLDAIDQEKKKLVQDHQRALADQKKQQQQGASKEADDRVKKAAAEIESLKAAKQSLEAEVARAKADQQRAMQQVQQLRQVARQANMQATNTPKPPAAEEPAPTTSAPPMTPHALPQAAGNAPPVAPAASKAPAAPPKPAVNASTPPPPPPSAVAKAAENRAPAPPKPQAFSKQPTTQANTEPAPPAATVGTKNAREEATEEAESLPKRATRKEDTATAPETVKEEEGDANKADEGAKDQEGILSEPQRSSLPKSKTAWGASKPLSPVAAGPGAFAASRLGAQVPKATPFGSSGEKPAEGQPASKASGDTNRSSWGFGGRQTATSTASATANKFSVAASAPTAPSTPAAPSALDTSVESSNENQRSTSSWSFRGTPATQQPPAQPPAAAASTAGSTTQHGWGAKLAAPTQTKPAFGGAFGGGAKPAPFATSAPVVEEPEEEDVPDDGEQHDDEQAEEIDGKNDAPTKFPSSIHEL